MSDADPPAPDGANDEALLMRINALKQEHRDLDAAIDALGHASPHEQLTIMRMKKRKLALKDEIAKLYDQTTPDIIA